MTKRLKPVWQEIEESNNRKRWYVFLIMIILIIIGVLLVMTRYWVGGLFVLAISFYFAWMLSVMPPAQSNRNVWNELSPEEYDRLHLR